MPFSCYMLHLVHGYMPLWSNDTPFVSSIAIFFPIFFVFVGAMIFAFGGVDVVDNIVVGCRVGTAGGNFFEGDPGNDPALLLNGVTATLDLDVGVEVHGPLSVGVLTSGDSAGLSSCG